MMNQVKNYNPNWSYIPDHLFRILIIDGSGTGRKWAIELNKTSKTRYWQNLFICQRST